MSFSESQQINPGQENPNSGAAVAQLSFPKTFIPPCFVDKPGILSEWRYEFRRRAQQVDDYLWLGPLSFVKEQDFLVENNIFSIISIADPRMVPAVIRHKYIPSGRFHFQSFDPGNRQNPMSIVSRLEEICKTIQNFESNKISTLIFCESGNEASAIAAVAYIMYKYSLDLIQAAQFVQSKRFSIALDDTAKYNLKTFEDMCNAKRPILETPRAITKKSRSRDEEDDDNDPNNNNNNNNDNNNDVSMINDENESNRNYEYGSSSTNNTNDFSKPRVKIRDIRSSDS